jgi:hypothetical protein
MRIKIMQTPREGTVDGMDLRRFQIGMQYEVGTLLGGLLLAEGWAAPVPSDEPAVALPMRELDAEAAGCNPPNLIREIYPPYYDGRSAFAAERRRKPRRE